MTSAVLNELAADACGAADPAEPFVHPNETLCENGLCRSLDREALRPWKTIHKGTCQIQFDSVARAPDAPA
jgi:hypothetical protein